MGKKKSNNLNGRLLDNKEIPEASEKTKKKLKRKLPDEDAPTTSINRETRGSTKNEQAEIFTANIDLSDEEDASDEEDLLHSDEDAEILTFDFEAFPMEEDDVEGIVNMLTQIFLNADLNLNKIATALIAQSPLGTVIGPTESCSDEEATNVVYGLLSLLPINDGGSNVCTDVVTFIINRAKKHAAKEIVSKIEEALWGSCSWLINERLLKFPGEIAQPSFKALHQEVNTLASKPDKILYICKLRVADSETKDQLPSKRKIGKAARKRLLMDALKNSYIEYDTPEDKFVLEITAGEAVYFDYNVEGEVEAGSKFGIQVRNGKTFRPYRRVIIMDYERFEAFVNAVKTC